MTMTRDEIRTLIGDPVYSSDGEKLFFSARDPGHQWAALRVGERVAFKIANLSPKPGQYRRALDIASAEEA